jgi:glycosyltransferase involved in cell wall biosynthesis
MWTKDGSRTLDVVLKRINAVVPSQCVNHRFIVDDESRDNTVEIAKANGWDCLKNEGKGISDGANTALKHVETEYFCSFEQDLLLSPDWWSITKHFNKKNIAVVTGIRLADKPSGLRKLQQYTTKQYYKIINNPSNYSSEKLLEVNSYGTFLDNTIYDTKILRQIEGFPKLPNYGSGTDCLLMKKMRDNNFAWVVDYKVISTHLRSSLSSEINHILWYGKTFPILNQCLYTQPITLASLIPRLMYSPVRALEIAIKMKEPNITYIYPLIRFTSFVGICKGYQAQKA